MRPEPYDERFAGRFKPRHIDEVASSENIAYILHDRLGVPPHEFEKSLKKIGGNYKKEVMKSFTVFYQFRPPFVEIPRTGWAVSSNYNSQKAAFAIDGDISTRWGTRHPQVRGMNFEIEIPRSYRLSKVEIRLGRFTMDYPETIELEISEDRERWKRVVFTTHFDWSIPEISLYSPAGG